MTPKPHFSPALRAGDFIFVSGQLPFDANMQIVPADIAQQTTVVIEHLARILASEGAGLANVVKTTVWLSDPADFAKFNETYAQHFVDGPPARATVGSVLMVPGALVEIEATAYCPDLD